ncbi:MAG: type II toxin-antitoxin system VapC family toxin [Myxococcaceae bacterium]
MSLRFLLDTNIISEPMQLIPNLSVYRKIKNHASEIAIASIVWHELIFGISLLENSHRKKLLQNYVDRVINPGLPILPYGEVAAHWHAQERARLQKIGIQIPVSDAQIAAIAYTNDLILVTRNEKDFKAFQGLKIENWFGAV